MTDKEQKDVKTASVRTKRTGLRNLISLDSPIVAMTP